MNRLQEFGKAAAMMAVYVIVLGIIIVSTAIITAGYLLGHGGGM